MDDSIVEVKVENSDLVRKSSENILIFCGVLSLEILQEKILETHKRIKKLDYSRVVQNRLQFIAEELLRNICKYSVDKKKSDFKIWQTGNVIYFRTINFAKEGDIKRITEIFNYLEMMEPFELKKLFRRVMMEGSPCPNSRRGHSSVQIRRKSRNPINYMVEPFDAEISKVTIEVRLNI